METHRFYTDCHGNQYVLSGIKNAFNRKTGWWLTKKGCTLAHYCFSTEGSEKMQEKEVAYHMNSVESYVSLLEAALTEKLKQKGE